MAEGQKDKISYTMSKSEQYCASASRKSTAERQDEKKSEEREQRSLETVPVQRKRVKRDRVGDREEIDGYRRRRGEKNEERR